MQCRMREPNFEPLLTGKQYGSLSNRLGGQAVQKEKHETAYSGEDDRHFRGNVTDGFNLLDWKLKRNVSGHDQSTFSVFC